MKKLHSPGEKFGLWTIVGQSTVKGKGAMWECHCACGSVSAVCGYNLRSGATKSCGCRRSEVNVKTHTLHGMSKSRPMRIWTNMKSRCYNANNQHFYRYGGRGISVCDRWKSSFANFWDDMKHGYDDHLQIDRINNDGNYAPENCRWATPKTNVRNSSVCLKGVVTVGGEARTVVEWAKSLGVTPKTIRSRIKRGWNPALAVTVPITERGTRYLGGSKEQRAELIKPLVDALKLAE